MPPKRCHQHRSRFALRELRDSPYSKAPQSRTGSRLASDTNRGPCSSQGSSCLGRWGAPRIPRTGLLAGLCCRTSSFSEGCRITSGPTTGLSSWPKLSATGSRPLVRGPAAYIEPGSPWGERLLRELQCEAPGRTAEREIFYSLAEAEVVEGWRRHYNTKRPHSSQGYRPPAPEVVQWPASPSGAAPPATPGLAPRPAMH